VPPEIPILSSNTPVTSELAYTIGIATARTHIPTNTLNSLFSVPLEILKWFWWGFECGYEQRTQQLKRVYNEESSPRRTRMENLQYQTPNKNVANLLFLIASRLKIHVKFSLLASIPQFLILLEFDKTSQPNGCSSSAESSSLEVLSIEELPKGGLIYVYDLETANHHFHVGPGDLVVHNTDSSMFTIPQVTTTEECDRMGRIIATELSDLFPNPLYLEYEKSMRLLCLKKKKYAALLIEPDGTFKNEILTRGIILARRDNCAFNRDIYESLLKAILHNQNIHHCFSLIMTPIAKAFRGEIPHQKFTIIKELGSNYKCANFSMNVFSKEIAKVGCPAQPGDRLEFVIVTTPSSIPDASSGLKSANIGLRMRLYETWKYTCEPPIDIMYYVTNVVKNSLDQLFNVGFKQNNYVFKQLELGHKIYSYENPLKMFHNITKAMAKQFSTPVSMTEYAYLAESLLKNFNSLAP
jgi:hypothetical protein